MEFHCTDVALLFDLWFYYTDVALLFVWRVLCMKPPSNTLFKYCIFIGGISCMIWLTYHWAASAFFFTWIWFSPLNAQILFLFLQDPSSSDVCCMKLLVSNELEWSPTRCENLESEGLVHSSICWLLRYGTKKLAWRERNFLSLGVRGMGQTQPWRCIGNRFTAGQRLYDLPT